MSSSKNVLDTTPKIAPETHRMIHMLEPAQQLSSIRGAARRLRRHMNPTLLSHGRDIPGCQLKLWYKCDHLRQTGSYKERGGLNSLLMLSEEERKRGVVAASAGNHAQALAYWGKNLKIPVIVVMPSAAPINKVDNCKMLGAEVVTHGSSFAEAKRHAEMLCAERQMTYINGYDHPDVIYGAATCGAEILDQLPEVDVVVVPVGGGGLIAGIALAIKLQCPQVKIIGVESDQCASMTEALKAKKPIDTPVKAGGTIADGLAVTVVGTNAFHIVQKHVDEVITVSEAAISRAILHMLEKEKILVEGAGCVGVAAAMEGKLDQYKDLKVVTVLCGGNIDMSVLGRVIERGMYTSGRLLQFDCAISDRVGGLARFLTLLSATKASVKDIVQQRPFVSDMGLVVVHLTIETNNESHVQSVIQQMAQHGFLLIPNDSNKFQHVNASKL